MQAVVVFQRGKKEETHLMLPPTREMHLQLPPYHLFIFLKLSQENTHFYDKGKKTQFFTRRHVHKKEMRLVVRHKIRQKLCDRHIEKVTYHSMRA